MNLALWLVAGLLAAAFAFAGGNKLFVSRDRLAAAPGGGWVLDFSPRFVRTLGVLELLGAIGLVLPAALGVAPVLVPLAAVGIGAVMVGAAIVTTGRHELGHAALNVLYLALAVFVAWGRFGPHAFG